MAYRSRMEEFSNFRKISNANRPETKKEIKVKKEFDHSQLLVDVSSMLKIYLGEIDLYIEDIEKLVVIYAQVSFAIDHSDVYEDIKKGIEATKSLISRATNSIRKFSVPASVYSISYLISERYQEEYRARQRHLIFSIERKAKYYRETLHQ